MRKLSYLQTALAFLSIPALLGWLFLTVMAMFYLPVLFGVLLAADSVYEFANVLAAIVFFGFFLMLGWWGWYSLLWVWFFYPHDGGMLPRHVFWGNIAGLVMVLLLVVRFIGPTSFSSRLSEVSGGSMLFLALCVTPAFLLLVNGVVVCRRAAQE